MPTHAFTLAQTGVSSGSLGSWSETTPPGVAFIPGFFAYAGLVFTKDAPTAKIWTAASLVFTYNAPSGGLTGSVVVAGVKRTFPPLWSSTNPPRHSGYDVETLYSASVTLDAAGGTLTLPLAVNAANGLRSYFGGVLSGDTRAASRFALAVYTNDFSVSGTLAVSAVYQRGLTGLETATRRLSRADECPKCGAEGFREDWVPDLAGVTAGGGGRGQLVCPSCQDPASPPRGPRTRLREVNP